MRTSTVAIDPKVKQAWEAISSGYSSNHDLYALFKLCEIWLNQAKTGLIAIEVLV